MDFQSSGTAGNVFRIAHYTIHDGPGIRTTVFLKGCPARCLWCCSPESQLFGPEMAKKKEHCLSCDPCCGDPEKCPGEALETIGRQVSPEELLAEVMRDAPFWRRSGGGVTVSGGEPLAQPDFLAAFLGLCKGRYIHTAIETSLFCSRPTLERVLGLLDFVQFDLKAMDPQLHRELTGLDNTEILDNARFLLRGGKPLLARIPLVPGCNDGEDNLRAWGPSWVSTARASNSRSWPTTAWVWGGTTTSEGNTPCRTRSPRPGKRWKERKASCGSTR